MIKTARQLKDKIRNMTNGLNAVQKSEKAQMLIRNYFMECLLERISVSKYRNNFILKGGMLVASYTGLESRATNDIDTTIRAFDLKIDDARKILEDIFIIDLGDGVHYEISSYSDIMEDFDYPGLRFMVNVQFDKIINTIKIDMSTDDVITPEAVDYEYKLMLEDRSIPIRTYNLETLLAEKLETIVSRGAANTRIRDFYDIHMLTKLKWSAIDFDVLKAAFEATSRKRGTFEKSYEIYEIINYFLTSDVALSAWENFKRDNYFVTDLEWTDVISSVEAFSKVVIPINEELSETEDEEQSPIIL